jgi:3-phenylpropionate/trans-cinnamate dioxygenase ferredoxin reductase component
VVISQEPGVPFGRPPLSKTYPRSEEDLRDWYVRPTGWYQEHDVELRTGCRAVADPYAYVYTFWSPR